MRLHIYFRAVSMAAVLLMLMSQGTTGCQCPSCHYADAAQNCQCCVYRQLGKRSDPALNFELSVPQNRFLPRYATANSAQASSLDRSMRMPFSLLSRDWSETKPLRQSAASYRDVSYEDRNSEVTRWGQTGRARPLPSLNQRMDALSRVLDSIKVGSALDADLPQTQDRPYDYSD